MCKEILWPSYSICFIPVHWVWRTHQNVLKSRAVCNVWTGYLSNARHKRCLVGCFKFDTLKIINNSSYVGDMEFDLLYCHVVIRTSLIRVIKVTLQTNYYHVGFWWQITNTQTSGEKSTQFLPILFIVINIAEFNRQYSFSNRYHNCF
jgi:hypothetical protein